MVISDVDINNIHAGRHLGGGYMRHCCDNWTGGKIT